MKKMSDKVIILLCVLITFFVTGSGAAFVGVFGYLPDYIGKSLVSCSGAISVFSAVLAVVSLFAARIVKKLTPKVCMLFASVCMIIYGLFLAFSPNLTALYISFGLGGLATCLGAFVTVGIIFTRRFGKAAGKYMSYIVGANLLGCGIFQGAAGIIFDNVGMRAVWFFIAASGVISLILSILIKPDPESDDVAEADATVTKKKTSLAAIFGNPAVWIFWIICGVSGGIATALTSYVTKYFPSFGTMSITTASTILSIMGIAVGIYNMFIGGKILQKFGAKVTCILIFACMGLAHLAANFYATTPAMWVVILVVLFYAVGATTTAQHAMIAPTVFDTKISADVMGIGQGIRGVVGILFPPVIASIITTSGNSSAFILSVGLAAICIVLYVVLFIVVGKKKVSESV